MELLIPLIVRPLADKRARYASISRDDASRKSYWGEVNIGWQSSPEARESEQPTIPSLEGNECEDAMEVDVEGDIEETRPELPRLNGHDPYRVEELRA